MLVCLSGLQRALGLPSLSKLCSGFHKKPLCLKRGTSFKLALKFLVDLINIEEITLKLLTKLI